VTTPEPTPSSDGPGGRSRRGVRAELARLLENWFERADEASSLEGTGALELAAVAGFLRRTDPSLLSTPEWEELRARIEAEAAELLRSADRRGALLTQLASARARIEGELAEFIAIARARDDGPVRRRASADTRIEAIRIAERVDSVLLAAGLALGQEAPDSGTNDPTTPAIEALAARAGLEGERFHTIEGWFAAMERSIDDAFLPDRHYWRGAGMLRDDRALLASAGWIQTTHARIRAYRRELAEATADDRAHQRDERRLRALEAAHAREPVNTECWRLVSRELAVELRADDDDPQSGPLRLIQMLADGALPRLAAARAPQAGDGGAMLEWSSPEDGAVAVCAFQPADGAATLVIEFYGPSGEVAAAFDGLSASWLGATVTIAGGQARFSTDALRAATSPPDVLRRGAALFIGGTLWYASFASPTDPRGGSGA